MNCQITKHLSCVAFIFSAWYYAYCAQCFVNSKKVQFGDTQEIFSKEIHDYKFGKIIWCLNGPHFATFLEQCAAREKLRR